MHPQSNKNHKNFGLYQTPQVFQLNRTYQSPQSFGFNQHNPANIITYRIPQVAPIGAKYENPDPNLLNVAKSVCKIIISTNNGYFLSGTGFFLKFMINGKFFYWLVTNEHVITKEMINNKKVISVYYNIESKKVEINLDTIYRYIKTFKEDHKVDATAIQIKTEDYVYEDYFLEPDLGYNNHTLL